MRAGLITMLVIAVSACGSKKEEGETDKQATPPATKPAPTKPTPTPEATQPTPSPEPAPPVASDAALDCDVLLTAADIESVCGAKVKAWKSDAMETKEGPAYCSRRAGPNGAFIHFMVGIYPHTSAAQLISRGAGAGKPAVESKRAGKAKLVIAHARADNIALSVRSQYIADKKPTCSREELTKLALVAAKRLPATK